MRTAIHMTRPLIVMSAYLAAPTTALAYRTGADLPEIDDDALVRWKADRVEMRLYEEGAPRLSPATLEDAITRAFDVWTEPSCSGIGLRYAGFSAQPAAPDDDRNTIQWLTEGWEGRGFDSELPGFTEIKYEGSGDDWRIVEADIYLNREHFDWIAEQMPSGTVPPAGVHTIVGALTHEAGHVLGLMHPCEEDTKGVPTCDSDPDFVETTMYPFYEGEDMLSDDDEAGICFLYPTTKVPGPDADPDADAGVEESCDGDDCPDAGTDDGLSCKNVADGGVCDLFDNREFGESCEAATQCASNECLSGMKGGPICTRRCGMGRAECPSGWTCAEIESEDGAVDVCIRKRDDSGCALARPRGSAPGVGLTGFVLVAGLFALRRRSRTHHQSSFGFESERSR